MDSFNDADTVNNTESIVSEDDPIVQPNAGQSASSSSSGSSSSSSSTSTSTSTGNTYADLFPPLPTATSKGSSSGGAWGSASAVKAPLTVSNITQVFHVPLDEQQRNDEHRFGESAQAVACKEVMAKYGVNIEMSSSKNRSLTIVVSGTAEKVALAKKTLLSKLQTQTIINVHIPKEHHKHILGKGGKALLTLTTKTATKIHVPKAEENTDVITITGTRENCEKARHEIQAASDEMSKLGAQKLPIPREYHPFIVGPNNATVKQIMADTGAKIFIPSPNSENEDIAVSGEKESVARAVQALNEIYEDKVRNTKTLVISDIEKKKHKYVIGVKGQHLQEIFRDLGVLVDLPPADDPSVTITIRGPQKNLPAAFQRVLDRANSIETRELKAPKWLHKYLIGKKGENLKQHHAECPDVQIDFVDDKELVQLEGPPEQVSKIYASLNTELTNLSKRLVRASVTIPNKFHKHIIGKNGQNINRIKEENNATVIVPSDEAKSDIIEIEGEKDGVLKAKQEIIDLAKKIADMHSEDMKIDPRYHKTLIGQKGQNIRELTDKFPGILINFPEAGDAADVVNIKGPKQAVLQAKARLEQLVKEIIANNYTIELPIFKKFHKYVIGKAGVNIKKIKDETDTKINFPEEESDNDAIVIIGKKANVEAAKEKILAIQNEIADITTVELTVAPKYHSAIIGKNGALLRSIVDECGGVSIQFPQSASSTSAAASSSSTSAKGKGAAATTAAPAKTTQAADKIIIRGPVEDVEKAKQQILELATDKGLANQTEEVKVKKQHLRFVIGRNGATAKQIRESTGARVIYPRKSEENNETLLIVGKDTEVKAAKEAIAKIVKDLESIVTEEIFIDPKYHKIFMINKAKLLKDLSDEFGGVQISFQKQGEAATSTDAAAAAAATSTSTSGKTGAVTLKGGKEFVELAKQKILDLVEDQKLQVTKQVEIAPEFHGTVLGKGGSNVRAVTSEFNVSIQFPESAKKQGKDSKDETESTEEGKKESNVIKVSGRSDKVDKAIEALLALVPITEEIEVPIDYHRFIIGASGKGLKVFNDDYDVNIKFPSSGSTSNKVVLKGLASNVSKAKEYLATRVSEIDAEEKEREARNFTLEVEIDNKYHPSIIGKGGKVVNTIKDETKTRITFPKGDAENPNLITIKGLEADAHAAKEAMLKIVREQEDQISEDVSIDYRVHRKLIGPFGKDIKKFMDENNVFIRFPKDNNSDLINIKGSSERVKEAKDKLKDLAEEYLLQVLEEEEQHEIMKQHMWDSRHDERQRYQAFSSRFDSATASVAGSTPSTTTESTNNNNNNNNRKNNKGKQNQNDSTPISSDFPTFVNTAASQSAAPPRWVTK